MEKFSISNQASLVAGQQGAKFRRMKTYFALEVISVSAVLALSGVSAQGQSGTISGFVRDSTNHESLSYVDVFVP